MQKKCLVSFLFNELITSLTTIHYRALPVLFGPQQHEIFTCRDCCRCFRPSVLFIHNGPRLPVIVAGGLWLSRPHSYLTLGPLHLLAHSQKHISQQPFDVPTLLAWCCPAQSVHGQNKRLLGIVVPRGQAAVWPWQIESAARWLNDLTMCREFSFPRVCCSWIWRRSGRWTSPVWSSVPSTVSCRSGRPGQSVRRHAD